VPVGGAPIGRMFSLNYRIYFAFQSGLFLSFEYRPARAPLRLDDVRLPIHRHCERSAAIQISGAEPDCRVAPLPAMTIQLNAIEG
jgi:hypothetical protein